MRSQKQIIMDIVQASTEHPTADQVFLEARRLHPGIAVGTVYRNLALLTQEGAIGRLEFPGEPVRYDKSAEPHEHLECRRCGEVRDLRFSVSLLALLREKTGEPIERYQLHMSYLCPRCREAEEGD